MIIAIGSNNPAKIKAVVETFEEFGKAVTIESVNAPSRVSNMPFSDEETVQGAVNRAEYSLEKTGADMAFGLEGGVMETPFGLILCNWGALAVKGQETLIAGGARIRLPDEITERLRSGEELGPLMDKYSERKNVRSNEGAIGILTNGAVNRTDMFSHLIKLLVGQMGARF